MRERRHTLNGGFAGAPTALTSPRRTSYNDAKSLDGSRNGDNAWVVRRSQLDGNNAYDTIRVRPVAALWGFREFQSSLADAFMACVRGKTGCERVMEYLPKAPDDLPRLAREVWCGEWHPGSYDCFMVEFPKLREVFASSFRDFVVQRWVCDRLIPVYERMCCAIGNPTHACRKGYGTSSAIEQVQRAMVRISRGYRREAWVYRGDIVSYYMAIDKGVMLPMIEGEIAANAGRWHDKETALLLEISRKVILHDPTEGCIMKSDPAMWDRLPPSKSLFHVPKGKGLPIGNLTTQLFAGIYMLGFLEYAQGLFEERYGRAWRGEASITLSVDDFAIVCSDKTFLKSVVRECERYLKDALKLDCHGEKAYLQPASHGVKFLGRWIKPRRQYIINRTAKRFAKSVERSSELARHGATPITARAAAASLNSYLGLLRGTRSHKIKQRALSRCCKEWHKYFRFTGNKIVLI